MQRVPSVLYTAAQVRELDRRAIEDHGIPGYRLMERAGGAAFRLLRLRWPGAYRIHFHCGGGNNGGDGLVVARLARSAGLDARVALHGDPERLRGAAASAWADWVAAGGEAATVDAPEPADADLVVDALLGTGLDRPVRGVIAEAIGRINACGPPVLALDIPSGLDADTGAVLGEAVRATATVTFIGAKRGLYTGSGPDHCGAVFTQHLDVPDAVFEGPGAVVRVLEPGNVTARFPGRRPMAHKGDAGHLLVVGGDHGFAGAARMAGEAALRSGAGLVTLATRAEHAAALAAARPELMAHPVESPGEALPELVERADAVAIGPGLGRGPWGRAALEAVLARAQRIAVVDADALNLLAEQPGARLHGAVITPHPGEAARLLGTDAASVQADRFSAADALVGRLGATVVLKGAGTLVAEPGGGSWILPGGRPAMAAGGMGDVLTGVVGALRVQGLDAGDSARCGAWLHAAAADRAVAERGTVAGLLPGDLMDPLAAVRETGARG
jgi:NAD(P)H-hydrate epimerase